MTASVAVADWIAADLGFVVPGDIQAQPREAMRILGIHEAGLADIKVQVRGILARIL